jgi:glycosyltransferase involved in cell wall biosynthesis
MMFMSPPLISVVIPSFNHADYLKAALQSVFDQTYVNWEAIVIDNHSTDNTDEVMAGFVDSRITYLKIHNKGLIAASRNLGIREAKGEWVAFLDSDDCWYPNKLKNCISNLEGGVELLAHGMRIIGERDGFIFCGPNWRATVKSLLSNGSCITPSATMVRKSSLEKVQGFSEAPGINTAEDYHLWIKLARENITMKFITEILGEYRVHGGNQSGSIVNHMRSVLEVIDIFLPVDIQTTFFEKMRSRRCKAHVYYGAARRLYRDGNFSKAWTFFLDAVLLRPFQLRSYVGIVLNAFYLVMSKFKKIMDCSRKR